MEAGKTRRRGRKGAAHTRKRVTHIWQRRRSIGRSVGDSAKSASLRAFHKSNSSPICGIFVLLPCAVLGRPEETFLPAAAAAHGLSPLSSPEEEEEGVK